MEFDESLKKLSEQIEKKAVKPEAAGSYESQLRISMAIMVRKAIRSIREQLDALELSLPTPTTAQKIAHTFNEMKAERGITKGWLESTVPMYPEDEQVERAKELSVANMQSILLPTTFLVSFRENPGLAPGSTSPEVNGVWFSVVGKHPITEMPIVAVHGPMQEGSIAASLRAALDLGFDGKVVNAPFDVRAWESLDGTWALPSFDHPDLLE